MHGKALECKNCAAKNIQDVIAKGNKIMRPLQANGLAPKYVGFGRRAKKLPKSGITGVYMQKGKYRAEITVDRKRIFLGSFETLKEAAAARHAAEVKYFGPRQKLADEIKEKLKKDSSEWAVLLFAIKHNKAAPIPLWVDVAFLYRISLSSKIRQKKEIKLRKNKWTVL